MRQAPLLDTFKAWLEAFGDAWESTDAGAMAELFAPGAGMQPGPFDERIRGREAIGEYWRAELGGRREVVFRAQVLGAGDTYGVAQLRVSYRTAGAGPVRIRDGILLAALDERGRCTSLRSWWHDAEEERGPS